MIRLLLVFLINALAYVLIYLSYHASAKEMTSRVVWTLGIVVGTIVGSTLGERFFK